jgi:starch-binding outer membrane protein, SusD/RagB family
MKMKSIRIYLTITLLAILSGCGNEFLDTKNLYEKFNTDYYSNPTEIQEALTAIYACLPTDGGNNNAILLSDLMSDDCFGGGGENDMGFHDTDGFTSRTEDYYLELWSTNYRGIFRANMLIQNFGNAVYSNEQQKNQDLGEAHFIRAFFYLRQIQFFGPVPLIIDPAPVNLPKATAEEIFGLIGSDLKKAIEIMPGTNYNNIPRTQLGHATKWAAQALMARAFLYYTGFYGKTEIELTEGGTISKQMVIDWLDDCITNSGHGLISDFRNLWPYAYAADEYQYAANNNLKWVGEEGDNIETIFAIKYSPYGGWNDPDKLSYSNQMVLYRAVRGLEPYYPFTSGWGGGTVNPQLWESFEPGDIRKKGSIIDVTDPEEGNLSEKYVWGVWECFHETGLWQKKYTPIGVNTGSGIKGMYFVMYGNPDNYQLWNMQDEVLIRFADVLLMGAELGGSKAQEYFDRIRTRAGLASKPATLENIKLERRHELAFEGIRYFDLQRWGDATAAFAKVKDVPVKNNTVEVLYTSTYRTETKGFLKIPESQVLLSEGILEQNEGW